MVPIISWRRYVDRIATLDNAKKLGAQALFPGLAHVAIRRFSTINSFSFSLSHSQGKRVKEKQTARRMFDSVPQIR